MFSFIRFLRACIGLNKLENFEIRYLSNYWRKLTLYLLTQTYAYIFINEVMYLLS